MATLDTFQTLKLVPLFEGEEREVNNFINIVEVIAETLKDDGEKRKLIKLVLKTRISERVRIKIGAVTTTSNIESFRNLFQQHFQRKLNPLKIQNEMARSKQNDQSVQTFASKIESLVTQLNNTQISESGEANSTIIRALNDKTALNAFQSGLAEPFRTAVFAAMPNTLEKAVEIASQMEAVNEVQNKIFHISTNAPQNRYNKSFNNRYNNNARHTNNYNRAGYNNYNKPQYNCIRGNQHSNQAQAYYKGYNARGQQNQRQQNQRRQNQRYQNRSYQQQNNVRGQNSHNVRRQSGQYNRYNANQSGNIHVLNSGNTHAVPEAYPSRDEEHYLMISNQ